jgi:hypothetical protein
MENNEPSILLCACSSSEHQIIIHPSLDDPEDKLYYCTIHLQSYGLFKRLLLGIRYIFGYKCKYGHWEEFILDSRHVEQLKNLSENLSE